MLPGSALERGHRDDNNTNDGNYKVTGSPVSSASSGHGISIRRGRSPIRRERQASGLGSPSAAKRMRHMGYTAVSPGGFESPLLQRPPSPLPSNEVTSRSYSRGSRRFESSEMTNRARNRIPDHSECSDNMHYFISNSFNV